MSDGYEFIGVILDAIGASIRYVFCKLFGSDKNFKYYFNNKIWLNRWLGFLIVVIVFFVLVALSSDE